MLVKRDEVPHMRMPGTDTYPEPLRKEQVCQRELP